MYGKIINGSLIYAPVNYLTDDRSVIFNFSENEEIMRLYGFKEVIDKIPDYDATIQIITIDGYSETDTTITINYSVTSKPISEKELLEQEKIKAFNYLGNMLTDEQALQVIRIFPQWNGNSVDYSVNERILYDGILYKVITAHTSQTEWTPVNAPSLFAKVINETIDGNIPEWEQPDSTNPYMKGDKILYNGKIYQSLIDDNVWSPTEYPSGWSEVN